MKNTLRAMLLVPVLAGVCLSDNNDVEGAVTVSTNPLPDYADAAAWVSRPEHPDKSVDVFFVHPTTYMGQWDGMVADLADEKINQATDATVRRQATVFVPSCNLFAPRYRQGSLAVLDLDEEAREQYLSVGLSDVIAAFKYYLENLNEGRPFILAGHSQGSNLLADFLHQHRELVNDEQLVAAYIIGWTVTDADLAAFGLPLASNAVQTGAVISWNTISEGGKSPVLHPGARCVNPLSWGTDLVNQPAESNVCAVIMLPDGSVTNIPHFTSAKINEAGALVIPVPGIVDELSMSMGDGVYHGYDYDFFYSNLVENVKQRCEAFAGQD
jgi:hypothetical protein